MDNLQPAGDKQTHTPSNKGEREREKKKSDFLCFLRKKMALISDTFLSNVSKLKQVYKKCVRMYNHSVHPF